MVEINGMDRAIVIHQSSASEKRFCGDVGVNKHYAKRPCCVFLTNSVRMLRPTNLHP